MSQENLDLIRRMYRAGETMSLEDLRASLPDLIAEFADPEIEWIEGPDRIDARTYRGHAGVREALQHWYEDFSEYTYDLREMVDCGDHVLVVAREEARGASSGATVAGESFYLFTVRDGKVARFRGFSDRGEALQAAGMPE
jgi:ketosteroid isomerase-like protein